MSISKQIRTTLLLISVCASLAGCASSSSKHGVLPSGGKTMSDIFNNQASAGGSGYSSSLDRARAAVPKADAARPKFHKLIKGLGTYGYGHVDPNNAGSPKMLPNPTIQIYVYPHFSGSDQDYVPGHMAYVKFYRASHFALPGEEAQ